MFRTISLSKLCRAARPLLFLVIVCWPLAVHGGGPLNVAGVTWFNSGVAGTPLVWSGGILNYYTDQGTLSPILDQAAANAFVADAFTRWTSITTAAVAANRAGALAEDVNGTNVYRNGDQIVMPADILPTATNKPLAIVYDLNGAVTDALLGQGAGGSDMCPTNSAYGGPDNFDVSGRLAHALLVINGNCAQNSDQLPDLKYHLVRQLGRILGLDWSQLNFNVLTGGPPPPTGDDYYGFPLMHGRDFVCVPISLCLPAADQPKMDDRAAISRLYPVTQDNIGNFTGKILFRENTLRVHGSVSFVDSWGVPIQPMQGVNVVARWIDPQSGLPSRRYAASCVSGFLFRGNAGNLVTGFITTTGDRFDKFGSADSALEGFFDLAGLEIPDGAGSAQYEITVEAMDPLLEDSSAVGPYKHGQVRPSGLASTVIVTINKGGDVAQDLPMTGSAYKTTDRFDGSTFGTPAKLPPNGDFSGLLSGYGEMDYFSFTGRGNRTMAIDVTALNESGQATEEKAQPVIGMWAAADPEGPPQINATYFNSDKVGLTRLRPDIFVSNDFKIGIADYRGDGRPDFRYRAHVLYGDTVSPDRADVRGGTIFSIHGIGFRPGTTVKVASTSATVLAVNAKEIVASSPALLDGTRTITLTDPGTGADATLKNAYTHGAAATDRLQLIVGSNPWVPVGGEAPNPIRVRVVQADGVTPVAGATVVLLTAPANGVQFSCGLYTCTLVSDEQGEVSARMTPLMAGTITVTARLAPASYPSTYSHVEGTLAAYTSALELWGKPLTTRVIQGASLDLPLTARALANGLPAGGRTIVFQVTEGTATVSPSQATTDSNGYATVTLQLRALSGDVGVTGCVSPGMSPCRTFSVTAVAPSSLALQRVSGDAQIGNYGQNLQPVVLRVVDSSTPPNPVRMAAVSYLKIVYRWEGPAFPIDRDEFNLKNPRDRVVLASSQAVLYSDADGLVSIPMPLDPTWGAVIVDVIATAGTDARQEMELQALWPPPPPDYESEMAPARESWRNRDRYSQ